MSRQIAPYVCINCKLSGPPIDNHHAYELLLFNETDRLTANVGMPDSGNEFHGRRPKWILVGDLDVDFEGASFVGCTRWPWECPPNMRNVIVSPNWLCCDLRYCICANIGELFCETAHPVGSHGGCRVVTGLYR